MHKDQLISCERLRCFDPPVESDASSEPSITSSPRPRKRKRSTRKREEAAAAEENAEEPLVDDDDDARSVTSTRSQSRLKKKTKTIPSAPNSPLASASAPVSASTSKPRKKRTKATHDEKLFKPETTPIDDDDMDVDDSASFTSKHALKGSKTNKSSTAGKGKIKAAMRPASRAKSQPSTSISTIEFAPSPESSPNHASASGDERRRKQSVSFAPTPEVGEYGGLTKGVKPRRPRTKKHIEVVSSSVDGES